MVVRPVKCPICQTKYINKNAVYNHIEKSHPDVLPQGMSGGEYYYRTIYGRGGRCVVCKKETTWNEKTNKFNRFCNNPKCKKLPKCLFRKSTSTSASVPCHMISESTYSSTSSRSSWMHSFGTAASTAFSNAPASFHILIW